MLPAPGCLMPEGMLGLDLRPPGGCPFPGFYVDGVDDHGLWPSRLQELMCRRFLLPILLHVAVDA